MNVAIVGTGYVGLVSGAFFSENGVNVTCVDIDTAKIEGLRQGRIPIYEPGLDELVKRNVAAGRLHLVTSLAEVIDSSDIVFCAVGTPADEDGSADLSHVLAVAADFGRLVKRYTLFVTKSTVPVGTSALVRAEIKAQLAARGCPDTEFELASNPEFLKEGAAIKDFMSPDRVVIGTDSARALEVMKALYAPFLLKSDRLIAMGIESAEMTKYAANAMLATKISFINEMSQICERVGANINDVRLGIGSDSRIGYSFIYPGCGYGGSCFPKDVKALEKSAADYGYEAQILKAVQNVNESQKMLLVEKIMRHFGEKLDGKSFAVWGLSFKPETDDMREASSLVLVRELLKRGAKVKAYDPKAQAQAQFYFKDKLNSITLESSKYDALKGCEALVLLTEWREFRSPDFEEIKKLLNNPIIFDGRNIYQHCQLANKGFSYYQIGVSN